MIGCSFSKGYHQPSLLEGWHSGVGRRSLLRHLLLCRCCPSAYRHQVVRCCRPLLGLRLVRCVQRCVQSVPLLRGTIVGLSPRLLTVVFSWFLLQFGSSSSARGFADCVCVCSCYCLAVDWSFGAGWICLHEADASRVVEHICNKS